MSLEALSVAYSDGLGRSVDLEIDSGGSFGYKVKINLQKIVWFIKYNTFHFYFGKTLFKHQWDLPFYRLFGKKVIMEYLGNDVRNYEVLVERYKLPSTHEYSKNMIEHDTAIRNRIRLEKKYLDYKLCCLPTHMEFALAYDYQIDQVLPLSIDLSKYSFPGTKQKTENEPLVIMHAPSNRGFKGTKYIIRAIEELKMRGHKVKLKIVENVSHTELQNEFTQADIFIDQISVGWYGTVALEAMAYGIPTCAFIDPLYFKFIDYSDEIPVININERTIADTLEKVILNRDDLSSISMQSRLFVEKYHDVKQVARKLHNVYQRVHGSS
jgi:glycosyltransferase involved in cell wall biosynthesis